MTAFLTMPDEPAAIPGWLDRTLIGPDLPQYMAELRLVHRPGPVPTLEEVLGSSREAFLEGGFAALPSDIRRRLLRNPGLLPELAELVFAEGGEHWLGGPLNPLEQARAEKVAANVSAALATGTKRGDAWRWAERVGWGLAVAAAVFLTISVTRTNGTSGTDTAIGPGWGFARIESVAKSNDPKVVYTQLAELAQEWGKKPSENRFALATRLSEFRLGCSRLQEIDLPLPPAEVAWLRTRCLDWSSSIDRHLRDLDERGLVPEVRAAATMTVTRIAQELRERAILLS